MPAFWFHYNKPESSKRKHPILTVHYKGVCHFVRGVQCEVPTYSRERKTQPRMVIAGNGVMQIDGDVAVIRREL